MENLIFSFNVMLPLVIEIFIGFLLRVMGIIDHHTSKAMNKVVFRVFLPVMIFYNLYTSEIADVFNPGLILFAECSIFALAALLCIIVPVFEKDNKKRGVIIQGIFRSNFVIFGLPLCMAISGESISGTVSVAVACVVTTFNFLAVIVLEMFNHSKPDIKAISKGVITNPLIIASVVGFAALLTQIRLPQAIENTIKGLSAVATPLGLVILGSSIDLGVIKSNVKQIVWAVAGKLVIVPAVFLALAALMGFRDGYLAILIAVFASPTAVSSYPMADQMGQNGELAAQIVMLDTCLCAVTVFMFIFVFKQLGLV